MESEFDVFDWLLIQPPYRAFNLGSEIKKAVKAILVCSSTYDAFCPRCGKMSTFKGLLSPTTEDQLLNEKFASKGFGVVPDFWGHTKFSKTIQCTRALHEIDFYFHVDDQTLYKVGQYPSQLEIAKGNFEHYLYVLDKLHLECLNKGLELATYGTGIGSYIYVRKVFEYLIELIHLKAKELPGWDEQKFLTSRFLDKTLMLHEHLPGYLKTNSKILQILGKSLQDLEEEECLECFNDLKHSVFIMIEEMVLEKKINEAMGMQSTKSSSAN